MLPASTLVVQGSETEMGRLVEEAEKRCHRRGQGAPEWGEP